MRAPPARSEPPGLLDDLRQIVGTQYVIDDPDRLAPFLADERGRITGWCTAVVSPSTTAETAAVVGRCARDRLSIIPQGGNTGLVGGGIPQGGIVLSTHRLSRIRSIAPIDRTITVEAGVILSDVQAAAAEAGALFPLSLAAEGSCRIGGNLATNAGGITVLRYGNARDLVLGLEVVLPDGHVWDGLRQLRKDNTGYDLKQLFIGSEGTLGVITAAVLKLFPLPRVSETALAAVSTSHAAVALFHRTLEVAGDCLTAFELMPRIALDFCQKHISGVPEPFSRPYPWYILLKLASPRANDPLRATLEDLLAAGMEAGEIVDAVIASSDAQAQALWRIRESIPAAQKPEGGSIKNDVAVPISRVAEFIETATAAVETALPGVRVVPFGHIGDGNIHFNLSQPVGADQAEFLARWDELEELVADIATSLGGTFSAEHGIGRMKRSMLRRYRSVEEITLMRRVKAALDPRNIMNPGVVLDPSDLPPGDPPR